jgi:outer membrane DcaP-like protein
MSRRRGAGIVPVIGWTLPAFVLATGLSSASADELADLRANQELLQRRIDQLAQAGPVAFPAPGGGPGGPVLAGSFPRSFVIPGTEVSLRVGGQGVGSVLWYLKGQAVGGGLGGQGGLNETYMDGQGGTGNLPSIPLNTHTFSNTAAPVGFAHSRSSEWDFSGKQTRFFLDARTPSPYGEVKAYIEMDFSASNTNTILNNNAGVTNGYIPRFRQGYATLGGLLMGQTNGTFVDNDADPELLDFGGTQGSTGRSRAPQVRYTYPLPYGMSIAVAAENPSADFSGPFGAYATDTNGIPTAANCAALTQAALTSATLTGTTLTTANAATNITNLCSGNSAFFNAAQNLAPDFIARWRIEQPWGHLQAGAIVRDLTLNDGEYLSRSWLGYGGALSGNFFTWGKDNLTWGVAAGDGIGQMISSMGTGAVATNFGGALVGQAFNGTDSRSFFTTNRRLYDSAVSGATIFSWGARAGYQHWWTPTLRSTVDFSVHHSDVDTFYIQASGRGANNKELNLAHANLIWSPVAFVDLGVEGAWGHRVTVANTKGDAWTLQTSMKFRF